MKEGTEKKFIPEEGEELTTERKEIQERMATVAKNVIDNFDFQPEKESMLVITDTGVRESQPELISAIQSELESRTNTPRTKGNFRIRVLPETKRSAEDMGDYVEGELKNWKNCPVLIITSMSRSHSKETAAARRGISSREDLDKTLAAARNKGKLLALEDQLVDEQWDKIMEMAAKKWGCRIISITKGKNPHEILTKGAVEESIEAIRERTEKVNELMKEVEKVHITSPEGTDIWLNLIDETKGEVAEDFSKPGSMGNYPIGEWACALSWEGSSGTLVVNGPLGGEHMLDQIKKYGPIKLQIRDGQIIKINGLEPEKDSGNPLVESVKAYLNAGNNGNNDAYRLAELGIGTNSKAGEGKADKDWGSTEIEKLYRKKFDPDTNIGTTIHIAVGSNGSLGVQPTDPSYNRAKVHCDMVLLGKINVECEKGDGSKFFLIENGEPQGY